MMEEFSMLQILYKQVSVDLGKSERLLSARNK